MHGLLFLAIHPDLRTRFNPSPGLMPGEGYCDLSMVLTFMIYVIESNHCMIGNLRAIMLQDGKGGLELLRSKRA